MATVALTPSVIKHLLTIPAMLDEFPFLRFAQQQTNAKVGRSCCGKAKRASSRPEGHIFETVKASVAHLPPERVAIIKKALKVDQLTVVLSSNGKQTIINR